MPPRISLTELYSMNERKKTARHVCFDHILEQCHRRIRTVASYGGMTAFFTVPGVIVGFPLYSVHQALEYVVDSLRETGFLVQLLPPPHIAVIYISWEPEELRGAAGGRRLAPGLAAPGAAAAAAAAAPAPRRPGISVSPAVSIGRTGKPLRLF